MSPLTAPGRGERYRDSGSVKGRRQVTKRQQRMDTMRQAWGDRPRFAGRSQAVLDERFFASNRCRPRTRAERSRISSKTARTEPRGAACGGEKTPQIEPF